MRLNKKKLPDFSYEEPYFNNGYHILGIDEVGRGPLAGAVFAACVYLKDTYMPEKLRGLIKDSKQISKSKIPVIAQLIEQNFVTFIASASVQEIEEINILKATHLAMQRACEGLLNKLSMTDQKIIVLVDGNQAPKLSAEVVPIISGDQHSVSIAAASIIAKNARMSYMAKLAQAHPQYQWHTNDGYGTKAHKEALKIHGPTQHHRLSFL